MQIRLNIVCTKHNSKLNQATARIPFIINEKTVLQGFIVSFLMHIYQIVCDLCGRCTCNYSVAT